MTMRRQACYVIAIAVVGGTGMALVSGSLHEAIRYGIALLTGATFRVNRKLRKRWKRREK